MDEKEKNVNNEVDEVKDENNSSTDNTNDDSNETPHIINKRKKKSNID